MLVCYSYPLRVPKGGTRPRGAERERERERRMWDYREVRSSSHDRETEDEHLFERDWSSSSDLLIKPRGSKSNAV